LQTRVLESPAVGDRPAAIRNTLLKICIYGYLNRVPSSRRLERECQRNLELIWLTGSLAPDFKTIADFRKAIREVCREFVAQALPASHFGQRRHRRIEIQSR
jgi:transposase